MKKRIKKLNVLLSGGIMNNDELLKHIKQLIEEIKSKIVFVDEPYVLEMRDKDANQCSKTG